MRFREQLPAVLYMETLKTDNIVCGSNYIMSYYFSTTLKLFNWFKLQHFKPCGFFLDTMLENKQNYFHLCDEKLIMQCTDVKQIYVMTGLHLIMACVHHNHLKLAEWPRCRESTLAVYFQYEHAYNSPQSKMAKQDWIVIICQ